MKISEYYNFPIDVGNLDGRRRKGGDEIRKWRLGRQDRKSSQCSADMFAGFLGRDLLNIRAKREFEVAGEWTWLKRTGLLEVVGVAGSNVAMLTSSFGRNLSATLTWGIKRLEQLNFGLAFSSCNSSVRDA